jgi:hypothetical protein
VPYRPVEQFRVAAGIEVPDEAAEPVLELHTLAVRTPVVDYEDAEIRERRVGTVVGANPIHALEHVVEAARRRPRRRGRGHASQCTTTAAMDSGGVPRNTLL